MKTLKFLYVILSCACAAGLDLNASKSNDMHFSSSHHFNNQNESIQIPSNGNFPS